MTYSPVCAFVDPLSGYTVLIQSYQWGYTDGLEYVTRDFGTTAFGTSYRQATAYTIRTLQCRFVAIDDVIDPLQTMTMIAQRHGGPVQFYPDASLGAYQWVQWPAEVPLGRVIENREEIELLLTEVGVGTNPNPPYIPPMSAGTIMVGGYGDATPPFRFLSPNGSISYPQPASAPDPGGSLNAMCRTGTGHIAVVGADTPFSISGAGLFNASDLSFRNQYDDSADFRAGNRAVTADSYGFWYVARLKTITGTKHFCFTQLNHNSIETDRWDIPLPAGFETMLFVMAIAVSGDGETMYAWLNKSLPFPTPPDSNHYVHRFSLSGAGSWLNQVTTDVNASFPDYQSLLVVPGSTDVIVAFDQFGGISGPDDGKLRRYTATGTVVWTAGLPAGSINPNWEGLTHGVPGDTHFLAWAYETTTGSSIPTYSNARYVWFDYATGTPDNTRNFTPSDGVFEFDSQFAVLSHAVVL